MKNLIIGGSSGLGLELARQMADAGDEVIITGRRSPKTDFAEYRKFDLNSPDLAERINEFVAGLPEIDRLVYTAGFYQEGRVTELTDDDIEAMIDVGGRALIYLMKSVLEKQGSLDELITITSTSQWTPRQKEPIYNFAKAGAGHFSNAMAEDGRVGKVLVAGPAGMKTAFWEGVERDDIEAMLDPSWVAEQIIAANKEDFRYKYIRILRQPPRIEEVEKR